MKKHIVIVIILIISSLASGIGSIITEYSLSLGIVLISIGVLITIYQIITQNIRNNYQSKMLDTQNILLATSGAGNVYQKMFESELEHRGKSPQGISHLIKAYQLEPDNIEVIQWLSISLTLGVLVRNWIALNTKDVKGNKDWTFAKQLVEKGLKIAPKEHKLMDTMGILYDAAGEHNKARKWFTKSSKFRDDPFWHLLMATSWCMSDNPSNAVKEVEQVIKEGVSNWLVDLQYGIALECNGRCKEALYYLNRAHKIRGLQPEISRYRMYARLATAQFSFLSVVDTIYFILFAIMWGKWHSLRRIKEISIDFLLSTLLHISRVLWIATSNNRFLEKIRCALVTPYFFAFHRGKQCLESKDYETAKNFFNICVSMCPDSIPALGNLSICYAFLGDREKAIELIDRGLVIESNNEILIWNKEQFLTNNKLRSPRFDVSANDLRKTH